MDQSRRNIGYIDVDDLERSSMKNSILKNNSRRDLNRSQTLNDNRRDLERSVTLNNSRRDIDRSFNQNGSRRDLERSVTLNDNRRDLNSSFNLNNSRRGLERSVTLNDSRRDDRGRRSMSQRRDSHYNNSTSIDLNHSVRTNRNGENFWNEIERFLFVPVCEKQRSEVWAEIHMKLEKWIEKSSYNINDQYKDYKHYENRQASNHFNISMDSRLFFKDTYWCNHELYDINFS